MTLMDALAAAFEPRPTAFRILVDRWESPGTPSDPPECPARALRRHALHGAGSVVRVGDPYLWVGVGAVVIWAIAVGIAGWRRNYFALFCLLSLGLVSILRGPGDTDRMMAAQLIGTGGIAALLLLGTVTGVPAAVDVALTLALLATFASIAFVKKGLSSLEADGPRSTEDNK